jgi:hypothetical protein
MLLFINILWTLCIFYFVIVIFVMILDSGTFKKLEIFEGQCFSDIYVLLICLERSHVLQDHKLFSVM